jgi:hypothetical protein
MPFPFSITYSTTLKEKIVPENYPKILQHIKAFIINKPAKDIIIESNKLSFKPGAYYGNWNIMVSIEKGIFSIIEKEGHVILTYEFFMYRLFITTGIMSVIAGIFTQILWIPIVAFLWLCGMNWITALARHKSMFDDLASEIDALVKHENDNQN